MEVPLALCEYSEKDFSDLMKKEEYIAFVNQFCEDLSEEDPTKFLMPMKNKKLGELLFSLLN